MCLSKYAKKYEDQLYFVFRVLVAFLFFEHGTQKLFGWFGGHAQALTSLMGVAGVIETVGSVLLFLGLWSRLVALVAGVEMLVAYVMMHAPNALAPLLNNGEPALLFFSAFLIVLVKGNGKWNLESVFSKKERF